MGRAGAQPLPQAREDSPAPSRQVLNKEPSSARAVQWSRLFYSAGPSRSAGSPAEPQAGACTGTPGWRERCGVAGTGACCREGVHWRGSSLLLALQSPCLPSVAQPNPPSASHGHHGASQLGQGCTGQPDAGPAVPAPSSGMRRTGPSPSPCPHCCRGSSAEDARGVPALWPGLGVLSVLLTVQSGSGPWASSWV